MGCIFEAWLVVLVLAICDAGDSIWAVVAIDAREIHR